MFHSQRASVQWSQCALHGSPSTEVPEHSWTQRKNAHSLPSEPHPVGITGDFVPTMACMNNSNWSPHKAHMQHLFWFFFHFRWGADGFPFCLNHGFSEITAVDSCMKHIWTSRPHCPWLCPAGLQHFLWFRRGAGVSPSFWPWHLAIVKAKSQVWGT